MSNIICQSATQADIAALAEMYFRLQQELKNSATKESALEVVESGMRERIDMIVAKMGSDVDVSYAGFAQGVQMSHGIYWCYWMYVEPQFRRQGIAMKLFSEMKSRAIRAQADEMHSTIPDHCTASAQLHAKMGYRVRKEEPRYVAKLDLRNKVR